MPQKSIIIIGAGVAGLAAGCYGQMNGYRTEIFEMHDQPGGLCTGWRRKGYTFDGCIHWLMGTAPESPFYKMWGELGVLKGRRMIAHEEFIRIGDPSGKTLIVYTNTDRFERHLLELSPADEKPIRELTAALRKWKKVDLTSDKPAELMNALDKVRQGLKMARYMPDFNKWANLSASKFAERFSDPFLRRAFPMIFGDAPMFVYLIFLAPMDHGDCGVPEGGSVGFSEAIEKRYQDLGGALHYKSRVEKILIEPCAGRDGKPAHKAVGIRLVDGSEYRADYVISAADGRTTLFKMLGGEFMTEAFEHAYEAWPTFDPMVQVSLGVRRDLSAEPHSQVNILDKPVQIFGKPQATLSFRHFAYDPTITPAGKSVVETFLVADYDYWKKLEDDDRERYEAEKQAVATTVIDHLETRYPGITADVEVVDVATPLTTERYTGNWKGSIEGFMVTQESMKTGLKKTLPGLDNFYMAGHWVAVGGGLPGVAPCGRDVIKIICHQDGKRFVTSVPD